ncbi:DUF6636 domain-containing protein [Hoeflea sp. CAU 1731]
MAVIAVRGFLVVLTLSLTTGSAFADGFGFMTPSGNIYCNGFVSGGGAIDCTIVSRSGEFALPKPASCVGLWGHEFMLEGSGPASMACGGAPESVDYSDIAGYGASADFGDISCTSERTGLTCRNTSGHGFFLSRRKQEIW